MSLLWSEEQQPNTEIRYNHVISVTPIGNFTIEWEGWKENDRMCVYFNDQYLYTFETLVEAKEGAFLHSKAMLGM